MKKISDRTHELLDKLGDSIIRDLNLNKEIIRDCFPLEAPYRRQATEALLTVETRMRKRLKLDNSRVGVDIIDDARRLGVFKRKIRAEEEGIHLMFRGSVLHLRNVLHHRKPKMDKAEAVKIILFSDYLIKQFEKLCKENKIRIT